MADLFTRLAARLQGELDGVLLPNLPSRFAPPMEIIDDGLRTPAAHSANLSTARGREDRTSAPSAGPQLHATGGGPAESVVEVDPIRILDAPQRPQQHAAQHKVTLERYLRDQG